MKKVVIICSRLDLPGGIERAVVNTANLLQSDGRQVTLLVLDVKSKSFYPLHTNVQIRHEPLHFGITPEGNSLTRKGQLFSHVWALRKHLQALKADVVAGSEYQFSIAAKLATVGLSYRVFAWEHHHFSWLERSRFWQFLFKHVYPKLAGVICLNPTEKALFSAMGCKTVVIPNFVEKRRKASLQSKTLLSVGWLIRRKGVDLIPAIAEEVFRKFPGWKWIIIGTGPEEMALMKAIREKQLANNVFIQPPTSPELDAFYADASLYVMTSRFECFPMVLLEAMAHGVPCISFDCPSGPSFIIRQGENGLLVAQENVAAMADAIMRLISNEEERFAFGKNAYESIERFSPATVFGLWKQLLAE